MLRHLVRYAIVALVAQSALLNGVPTPFVVEVQMEFRLHREGEPRTVPAIPGFKSSGSGLKRAEPCTPPK